MRAPSVRAMTRIGRRLRFWFGASVLIPLLIWYGTFAFYPILRTAWISLHAYNALNPSISQYVGLDNYRALPSDPQFTAALRNTVAYVIVKMLLAIPLAVILAVLLERSRFRQFYTFAFFLPGVMSLLASAVLFKYFYDPNVGLFNRVLTTLGLPSQTFIYSIDQALYSVAAMDAWRSFGFYTLLLLAALLNVPSLLYEAARIDGASELLLFFRITLPLIRRTLLLVFVIGAIDGAQVFAVPYYMSNGFFGPGRSTLTLAGLIYNQGLQDLNLGYASAVAFILFLMIMAVTLVQLRVLRTTWEY